MIHPRIALSGEITEWILGSEAEDDDGGMLPLGEIARAAHVRAYGPPFPAPFPPCQNPAREKLAGGMKAVSLSGTHPDSWGAGARPVVVGRMWLGTVARAPPVKVARAFRARGRLSFPRSVTRALGGVVVFGPSGTEPTLSHPAPDGITRQARQGLVRPAFAVTQQTLAGGRPGRDCGSNAAGRRPGGHPTVPAIRADMP